MIVISFPQFLAINVAVGTVLIPSISCFYLSHLLFYKINAAVLKSIEHKNMQKTIYETIISSNFFLRTNTFSMLSFDVFKDF